MRRYRVCFNPIIFNESTVFYSPEVGRQSIAQSQLDAIANYTLFLHDKDLIPDYSNYGFVQTFIDGEWVNCDDD